MKFLVTGANGLLATNTILELLRNNHKVVGLLRDKSKFSLPPHTNLELIEGDLLNTEQCERFIKGCDHVIHAAAETRQGLPRYSDYHRVNVTATENIINAAIKNNIKKIVYVSTANIFGHGTKEDPGDERSAARVPFSNSHYIQSKINAQQLISDKSKVIDIVTVSPSFILGPYDNKPGSGRILLMGHNKKIVFYPPGGKNFVHVKDVVAGILSALNNGKSGETYLLCNENLSYAEFFQKLAAHSKKQAIHIKIPAPLLISIGIIGSALQLVGIKSEFTLVNMRILCASNFYTNQKARTELRIDFTPVNTGISEALEWFKEKKFI